MRRFLKALAGGVTLCILLSLCGFDGQCQAVRNNVVRLHILANSDTAEDQTLKLKVRDAVTAAADGWFDGANGETEALAQIEKRLPALQEIAQEVVYKNGYAYPVQVKRCRMYFETRQYGNVTMPAEDHMFGYTYSKGFALLSSAREREKTGGASFIRRCASARR